MAERCYYCGSLEQPHTMNRCAARLGSLKLIIYEKYYREHPDEAKTIRAAIRKLERNDRAEAHKEEA